MRARSSLLALALALLVAGSAYGGQPSRSNGIQILTIVNTAGVPAATIAAIERGALLEANGPLHHWWHTPRIRFGPGGWKVTILTPHPYGMTYHSSTRYGTPYAVINWDWDPRLPAGEDDVYVSHEIMEMLVRPRGARPEVCDPVEDDYAWTIAGVPVADFVTPAWFKRGSAGPWDAAGILAQAGARY